MSLSKWADVYSLGLIFYYCFSRGKNPNIQIVKDKINKVKIVLETFHPEIKLEEIEAQFVYKWKAVLAVELIEFCCSFSAVERPNTETILKHPLFWENYKVFDFLQVCFDFMSQEINSIQMRETNVETGTGDIVNGNWIDTVKYDVHFDHEKYSNDEVLSLLKCIHVHVTYKYSFFYIFCSINFVNRLNFLNLNSKTK